MKTFETGQGSISHNQEETFEIVKCKTRLDEI